MPGPIFSLMPDAIFADFSMFRFLPADYVDLMASSLMPVATGSADALDVSRLLTFSFSFFDDDADFG